MAANRELTAKQADLLQQFKKNVKDVSKPEFDDAYLCRWLRAREWEIKKSEKMLRDSLNWRKSFKTDTMLEWTVPEVIKKYSPGGYYGHDKNGIPIWYELLGMMDIRGMLFSATKLDIIRNRIRETEHLFQNIFPAQSKKFGRRIDQVVYIFDMEGIGMKHVWKPGLKEIACKVATCLAGLVDR